MLVAEIETSKNKSAFQLKPTYLFYAASADSGEKKTNAKKRKLAFNFAFARPDSSDGTGQKVFATPIIEFPAVRPGVTRSGKRGSDSISILNADELNNIKSPWFAMPAPLSSGQTLIDGHIALTTAMVTNLASAAKAHAQGVVQKRRSDGFTWDNTSTACDEVAMDFFASPFQRCEAELEWLPALREIQLKHWALEGEAADIDALLSKANNSRKPTLQRRKQQCVMASRSVKVVADYLGGCNDYVEADKQRNKLEPNVKEIDPTNVQLTVVEDYEKPFLKFFAEVLGEQEVKTGIESALSDAVDPAKRKEARDAEQKAEQDTLEAYERALVEAQKAVISALKIDVVEDPLSRQVADIDTRVKKLAANRAAQTANRPLPYPEIGLSF